MENKNVCENCGRVRIHPTGTERGHKGHVCKECNQVVQPGTEHEHKEK